MLGSDVPIDLDRAEAARQAAIELANPAYRAARPSWLEQVIQWLLDRAGDLAGRASAATPGGWWGILGLVVVVGLTVVAIRWRLGPVARTAGITLEVDPNISAAQYRDRSVQAAAAGDWDAAIGARMSAMVRLADERGLAPDRPGRTVDEFAELMAESAPQAAPLVRRAVIGFDRVRYGGRPADQDTYIALQTADEALADAAPRAKAAATPQGRPEQVTTP